ncbi:hypothetical protein B7T06_22650, partial [Cronobacter sakazakii]
GGCAAAAWRSGADDPAGTDGEPEGARVLAVVVLLLLFICRKQLHSRSRRKINGQGRTMKTSKRIGGITRAGKRRMGHGRGAAGAPALPCPAGACLFRASNRTSWLMAVWPTRKKAIFRSYLG